MEFSLAIPTIATQAATSAGPQNANKVSDRDALLDAWLPRHGGIRNGRAATYLAPLARCSRVELYCDDVSGWDEKLGLFAVPRGGNLVLIRPADRGVFDGSFTRDGVTVVRRPQLYVDLKRRGGSAELWRR